MSAVDIPLASDFVPRVAPRSNLKPTPIDIAFDLSDVLAERAVLDPQNPIPPVVDNTQNLPTNASPSAVPLPVVAAPVQTLPAPAASAVPTALPVVPPVVAVVPPPPQPLPAAIPAALDGAAKMRGLASRNPSRRMVGSNRFKSMEYKVKRGDTLMKIAFQTYGDLSRWREIWQQNQSLLSNSNFLRPGALLKIQGSDYIIVERNGLPYLIRRHDTLSKISHYLYGSNNKWRSIWLNNRQLIHDPNKIYAGFTLYYKNRRGVANQ